MCMCTHTHAHIQVNFFFNESFLWSELLCCLWALLTTGTLQAHPGFGLSLTVTTTITTAITFYYCEQKLILFLTGF